MPTWCPTLTWAVLMVCCALPPGACSTARPLRPLAPGAFSLDLSLPGTWTASDSLAFPVADLLIGGRYGVIKDLEVRANLHALPLVHGIVAVEGGCIWHARAADHWIPALHLSSDLLLMTSPRGWGGTLSKGVRGALSLTGTAHWEPRQWLWPYLVLDNALVLLDGHYVASVFVGIQSWVSPRWAVSLETGLAGLTERTLDLTQPFYGVAGRGALWLGLAVSVTIGGESS